MDVLSQYHYHAAALLARILLGCLFFFQGYDAVFNVRVRTVIATFENRFAHHGIPRFLTVAGSWFTSLSALTGGALLIAGIFKYAALYLLSLNLVVAAIGFGINIPVWDTRHVFPRLALLLLLLLLPESWDTLSFDHLFFK